MEKSTIKAFDMLKQTKSVQERAESYFTSIKRDCIGPDKRLLFKRNYH
jgi:hypothetical protein